MSWFPGMAIILESVETRGIRRWLPLFPQVFPQPQPLKQKCRAFLELEHRGSCGAKSSLLGPRRESQVTHSQGFPSAGKLHHVSPE